MKKWMLKFILMLSIVAVFPTTSYAKDNACSNVTIYPPPATFNVGERKGWTVFDYAPAGTCDLNATIHLGNANIIFVYTRMDLPYTCALLDLQTIHCIGEDGIASLYVEMSAQSAGSESVDVTVNTTTQSYTMDVTGYSYNYLPLVRYSEIR